MVLYLKEDDLDNAVVAVIVKVPVPDSPFERIPSPAEVPARERAFSVKHAAAIGAGLIGWIEFNGHKSPIVFARQPEEREEDRRGDEHVADVDQAQVHFGVAVSPVGLPGTVGGVWPLQKNVVEVGVLDRTSRSQLASFESAESETFVPSVLISSAQIT